MTVIDGHPRRAPAVSLTAAGGAAVALATAIATVGCSENCTLNSVPAVEMDLQLRDGTPIVEVSYSLTFDGKEIGPLPCGGEPCERLVIYADVEPARDFELAVHVVSPAFVPITATYEIESDGCHPLTQQDALVLDWRPSDEFCAPFCANAFGCEADVPWASAQECTDACIADIADPAPDACVPLYRGLYGCLGAGTCEDYLEYRNEVPGHRCEAHLDAIGECESAW